MGTRTCKKCGATKPIEVFRPHGGWTGYTHTCLECHKAYQRRYYQKNKQRAKSYQKDYYKEYRELPKPKRGMTLEQLAARKQCGRCYSPSTLMRAHGNRFISMIDDITSGRAVYAGSTR